MEQPLLHERELLAVVDEDVEEPLVQRIADVVEVRDQLGRVAQQRRVVDPRLRCLQSRAVAP